MATPDRQAIGSNLAVLARRVARNREIAGLHYDFDSSGGAVLATSVAATMINNQSAIPTFDAALTQAAGEWS